MGKDPFFPHCYEFIICFMLLTMYFHLVLRISKFRFSLFEIFSIAFREKRSKYLQNGVRNSQISSSKLLNMEVFDSVINCLHRLMKACSQNLMVSLNEQKKGSSPQGAQRERGGLGGRMRVTERGGCSHCST